MLKIKVITYLWMLLGLSLSCNQVESQSKTESPAIEPVKIAPKFSLKNNRDTLKFTSGIRSILQDSRGDYWIGSHNEGICRFNGETFEYFDTDDGLSHNQVRTIQEDGGGIIWFGTAEGVSNFDGVKINNFTLKEYDLKIEKDWALTTTDLWFAAGNSREVIRVDQQQIAYLDFPIASEDEAANPFYATGFSKGKKGSIWIAYYAGVIGYDGHEFTLINDALLGFMFPSQSLHVRSILEDSQGRLWIGNNGIGAMLREEGKTINFSRKMGLLHKKVLPDGNRTPSPPGTMEHVFAISEDSKGNIWFGDRDTGAWKYDGNEMTNYTVDSSLKSQMIWHIYEDQSGDLLFAMQDRGIYRFNGGAFDRVL
ncbi:MAG: hypothetical protein Sapg2KO_21490 [Saprospiraceae bacterium]